MKRIAFLLVAAAAIIGAVAWMAAASVGQGKDAEAGSGMAPGMAAANAPTESQIAGTVVVTTIPKGYRDWKFVSAAHEAGTLEDIRVVIGNDRAIEAYRAGKPFPEGSIVGRVAWKMVPSEENNRTFGQEQSFVPGDAPDWYLQFMVKDSKKYASTGGWGYSNFGKDLQPLTDKKTMYSCYQCHQAVTSRDYVFTKYAQ